MVQQLEITVQPVAVLSPDTIPTCRLRTTGCYSAQIELQDIADEVERLNDQVQYDPQTDRATE